MQALDHLFDQLHQHPNEPLLIAAKYPVDQLTRFAAANNRPTNIISPLTNETTISLPNSAFAVVLDYLEHTDKRNGLQQLALWRNLHCNRLWIAIDANQSQWQFQDFIGLGCKRLGCFSLTTLYQQGPTEVVVYGYDLGHYNHRRQWNNSRYWANPEMWHRRW